MNKPVLFLVLFALLAGCGAAQEAQRFDFDRPEVWAMKYFASASLMVGQGPLADAEPGSLFLGVELSHLPHLSRGERTVGFFGSKEENLNNAPVSLRPSLHWRARRGVELSVAYVPPVELWDVKPSFLSGAIELRLLQRGPWALGLRGYGQVGFARGPFTGTAEEAAAGNDPQRNPWGILRPSDDHAHLNYGGVALSGSYRFPGDRGTRVFGGAAWTRMDLEFRIDSTLFFEEHDRRQKSDGETVSWFGGVRVPLGERWEAHGLLLYAPLDVIRSPGRAPENDSLVQVRLGFTWRWK